MKKIILILLVFLFPLFLIYAKDINQMTETEIKAELEASNKELLNKNYNEQTFRKKLNEISGRIKILGDEITQKEKEVAKGEDALKYQKNLLNERTRSYYKNINKNSKNLLNVLTSRNISESLRDFFYQKTVVDRDKDTIIKVVLYIKNLEETKLKLEEERNSLAFLQKEVDRQLSVVQGEISNLKQKITQLSARQQELIAAKLASVPIPRAAETSLGGCKSDIDVDPGFSPRFAFFSYGVPNKVGMNQYGAKGRAEEGQNFETILRAYYNFDEIKKADTNIQINVNGHGQYSLEEYAKRIYEVPETWSLEALKAQAIAARSYALAYTDEGKGSICDSESCQVFHDQPKTGAWDQAVRETEGLTMYKNGKPIKAWFSSTHGGVILSSSEIGWSGTDWTKHALDTRSGSSNSFADLQSNAYDKSSPWFYCDWGFRSQYNNTAWLKQEEVVDLVNAYILYELDNNTITHLSQVDKNLPDNWSFERVRQEIKNRGGNPINSINSIYVSWDNSGISGSINVDGRSFPAQKFKNLFNIRAPANIQIKPACYPDVNLNCGAYGLYNVEKR